MKTVLLIAGGGTLGSYTTLELLKMGHKVDVIALEELTSYNKNLTYIRRRVDDEFLTELLNEKHYDAIVDFLHYPDMEVFQPRFRLLSDHTDRYVFLSSYRVFANEEIPIRETSPQLLDVYGENELLSLDTYGIRKSYGERYIRASGRKNWTIIRPLISFSKFRFDLVTLGGLHLFPRTDGRPVILPADAKDKVCGLGWAGNVGKLIAGLIFSPAAVCEDFNVGNDENLTWGQIASIYEEVMGLRFVWVSSEDYLSACTSNRASDRVILYYDRLFDRRIDNTKVLEATGTSREEMIGFREALIRELQQLSDDPNAVKRFTDTEVSKRINKQMDDWLTAHGMM